MEQISSIKTSQYRKDMLGNLSPKRNSVENGGEIISMLNQIQSMLQSRPNNDSNASDWHKSEEDLSAKVREGENFA